MTRRYAPDYVRVCPRRSDWPAVIRYAFDQAFGARDRPRRKSEGGALPRATSIDKYERSLGRFIGHLRRSGLERPDTELLDYLMNDRIRDNYFKNLLERGLSDHTVFGSFEDLRIVAGWLYPGRTLPAIMHAYDVPIRLLLTMQRRDVQPPPREDVKAWCQDLFADALEMEDGQSRWLQVRDSALFAVLAALGPRLASAHLMQVGVHLRRRPQATGWWVCFDPPEVKQDTDYEYWLEDWTWPIIERYQAVERLSLLGRHQSTALWIARGSRQLCAKAIWHVVHRRSLTRFERGYGVHMFRHSLATDGMRTGEPAFGEMSKRLGHRSLDMSMRYVDGSAITAVSERHSQKIDALTGKNRLTLERVFPEAEEPVRTPRPPSRRRCYRRQGWQLNMFAELDSNLINHPDPGKEAS
nr:hypothetical protein [uncultured Rhodopila sp.]